VIPKASPGRRRPRDGGLADERANYTNRGPAGNAAALGGSRPKLRHRIY